MYKGWYGKKLAAITTVFLLGNTFSSFANGPTSGPVSVQEAAKIQEINQQEQMVKDLYHNEQNPVIREMAIDLTMAGLTGVNQEVNLAITKVSDDEVFAGSYPKTDEAIKQSPNQFMMAAVGDDFLMYVGKDTVVTSVTGYKQENSALFQNLYQTAQELCEATKLMDERGKAEYIHDYICNALSYDNNYGNRSLAAALSDGIGVCNDYSGLFYLFGTYCGLKVENVAGTTDFGYHSWNSVEVNGAKYHVDATWDDTSESKDYFWLKETPELYIK